MSQRILVKFGGSALGHQDTTIQDLAWLQQQGRQPIVVHGGGKVITQWLERMQMPTRFVRGLRVTDEASIDVVVGVLAGVVNKQLVAQLNAAGARAAGLSGADGVMLRAHVKDPDLGLVGEIARVDPAPVEALLQAGYLPVISPIGVLEEDGRATGTLLNINADTAAAEVGAALKADQFVFMTDVPGVLDGAGKLLPALTPQRVRELIASGVISGGMAPKVEACLRALRQAPSAAIVDGRQPHALRELLEGRPVGTTIR